MTPKDALSAVLLMGSLALVVSAAQADELGCEQVERYTLGNGIDVVLQQDGSLPLVAVVNSVHAGSRNDPPGYAGLAHYVEHLLFREGGPFVSAFELYQGSGATMNALTRPDTTDYLALLPSEQLERALWIEARRLGLGLNALEESTAEAEKQVVLREQNQSRGYQPELSAAQAVDAALYGEGHPYHSLYSTVESIEPQTLADARWFFAQHYRLEQVRLIVVGDFEPTATRALIERYFGSLSQAAPPAPGKAPAAVDTAGDCRWAKQALVPNARRVILRTRSSLERIEITWPMPAGEDLEQVRPALGLLVSSVADKARQADLSHDVSMAPQNLELVKLWKLQINLMPGAELAQVEALVWEAQAELSELVQSDASRRGTRRSSELIKRLTKPSLLDRALKLTARECAASRCAAPSGEITPAQIALFDKKNALVFIAEQDKNASPEGSVEVLP
jgi:hypothetical protein